MMNTVLITGAGGYAGSLLVENLLKYEVRVIAFDTFWFGNYLPVHPNLKIITGDLRTFDFKTILPNVETVVHLACISNDPSYELNPAFSEDINYSGSMNLISACRNSKINRFIYASSSSVYGVKSEEQVTENLSLEPLTPYSYFKVKIEHELHIAAKDRFDFVILRPATLCGPSPRLRLDVIGNIFAAQAYFNKEIIIHGGEQFRPQLNIRDMIRAYEMCIFDSKNFYGEIYNIGENNYTVSEIAELTKKLCPHSIKIIRENVKDNRSYRLNSNKIKTERDFHLEFKLSDSIQELFNFFSKNELNWTNDKYHNIKTIKNLLIDLEQAN